MAAFGTPPKVGGRAVKGPTEEAGHGLIQSPLLDDVATVWDTRESEMEATP